jgi:hypothetical protein
MGKQEDRQKILEMLAKGTIYVDEADKLLSAMNLVADTGPAPQAAAEPRSYPKYLRVQVEPKSAGGDRVNIRVPFQLIRAGVKFAALVPLEARLKIEEKLESKGMKFDLSSLSADNLDQLVTYLSELTVDVEGEDENVRIFCE